MNYNQLTYHKASPFFKQGYLPDRAWYNRKPKQFPSQIPTGQDYFTQVGRKHYRQKFNHSEIQDNGVLTSPEKYPFQNTIAHDKAYMRSLDTTDIEGAGSGTRVNQAVRYKLRAQEELARKYNQSLDMSEHKEHEYQQKRRKLAINRYHNMRKGEESKRNLQQLESSRLSNNPQRETTKQQLSIDERQYSRNVDPNVLHGSKYVKLQPKPYYQHLEQPPQEPHYSHPYIEPKQQNQREQHSQPEQPYSQKPQEHHETTKAERAQQNVGYVMNANDRHKSNPSYLNHYDQELLRRKEDYMKTIEMDQVARNKLSDKQSFRRNNPTNLSFNLAGQSVVGNKY